MKTYLVSWELSVASEPRARFSMKICQFVICRLLQIYFLYSQYFRYYYCALRILFNSRIFHSQNSYSSFMVSSSLGISVWFQNSESVYWFYYQELAYLFYQRSNLVVQRIFLRFLYSSVIPSFSLVSRYSLEMNIGLLITFLLLSYSYYEFSSSELCFDGFLSTFTLLSLSLLLFSTC